MIEIDNISVSFGGVRALSNVSAMLRDPIVGIIGPNGAGKTTLLNVFSGFVTANEGTIRAFGADVLAMTPHRRARWGLHRSFQTEQVVDDLSVADNVQVMLDCLPYAAADKTRDIAKALDYVRIGDKSRQMGQNLNTFERRMVELAKTFVGAPKLVLLDEPGAGLRAHEVETLREVIVGINGTFGATTLLIDHNVELIAATCVSTLVLDFGQVIAYGPTAEVLRDPRVKAAYLGIEEVA
jgi:ABC-type branched-subunit amino acid transport system ATPase component